MKRISIKPGTIGLVVKDGRITAVLKTGKHWVRTFANVRVFALGKSLHPFIDSKVLLQNKELAAELEVVEVADHERVVVFESKNYSETLAPGRYLFWKHWNEYRFVRVDLSKIEITEPLDLVTLSQAGLFAIVRKVVIEPHEKGLLFADGVFERELKPGVYHYWKNKIELTVRKADLRTQQLEISGQEILTKDKAGLRLSFFVHYRITDVKTALLDHKDFEKQLYLNIQLALRQYIGTTTLDDLLDQKDSVTAFVREKVEVHASELGIRLMECGIRDIILPGDMKLIMNRVLMAQKEAQANTITRREETAATRSLLNTAKLMEDNPMLMKLKEMEYVEKIADKINTISLSNGGQALDQLQEIFAPGR